MFTPGDAKSVEISNQIVWQSRQTIDGAQVGPAVYQEGKMYALTYLQSLALRLRKDKSGAVATEYAFLIAFIAIVAAIGR